MQLKGKNMNKEFDNCIGLQLKITKNIMENEHNKFLKEFGVSSEQGLLLKCAYEMPGCTQTQIAEYLFKDKTTITRMVDTLVKKGKLIRKNSNEDRRVHHIFVTPETEEKILLISPIFEKREEDLREIIGLEDYERTLVVLNKIREYYRGLNK